MRTFVHFDSTGAIQSLVAVDGPEGVSGGPMPDAGISVDEVEGVELKLDELDVEGASEIIKSHRVEPASSSPRKLVKK
jgi:hypothetical protein